MTNTNFFAANTNGSFFSGSGIWILLVFLVAIIAIYVVGAVRRKKYNEQTTQMQNELRPGTKVRTYSGFYGKIVSIKETTDGKIALLQMGEGNKVGYVEVDLNAVCGIDQKEEVVYDKDGNIIVKENRNKTDKDSKPEEQPKTEKAETKDAGNTTNNSENMPQQEQKNDVKEYQTFEEKKASKKSEKSRK